MSQTEEKKTSAASQQLLPGVAPGENYADGGVKETKKETGEIPGIDNDSPVILHVVLQPSDRRDVHVTGSFSSASHFQESSGIMTTVKLGCSIGVTFAKLCERYHSVQKTY